MHFFFFFCRLSAYIWRLRADPVHHVLFSFPYLFFFFFDVLNRFGLVIFLFSSCRIWRFFNAQSSLFSFPFSSSSLCFFFLDVLLTSPLSFL